MKHKLKDIVTEMLLERGARLERTNSPGEFLQENGGLIDELKTVGDSIAFCGVRANLPSGCSNPDCPIHGTKARDRP